MRSFCITADCAPVAQLDRALPSGGRGHRFESYRVRQNKQPPIWRFFVLCTRGLEPTFEKSAGQPILTSCKRRPEGEVQEAPNQSYRVKPPQGGFFVYALRRRRTVRFDTLMCLDHIRTALAGPTGASIRMIRVNKSGTIWNSFSWPGGRGQDSPSNPIGCAKTQPLSQKLRLSYATFCSNICGERYGIITFILLSAAAFNAAVR